MAEQIKIVAIEEHVALDAVLDAWAAAGVPPSPQLGFGDEPIAHRLRNFGAQRVSDMDDQGVDVAVLSLASPGLHNLAATDAVHVARDANDELAEIVAARPDRYQALAAIPTSAPQHAAAELERAVSQLGLPGAMLYGRTGATYADARCFDDLYATAERLRAPLHFHPQIPSADVVAAYYADLDDPVEVSDGVTVPVGLALATAGIGW